MPELPEVQTVVDSLNAAQLQGRRIREARVFWPKTIADSSVRAFCRRIKEQSIKAIRRRGKFIVMDLSGGDHLLIHLRMTGQLHLHPAQTPRKKHEHLVLLLDDRRQLHFQDTRKFGRVYLVRDVAPLLGILGPEPLGPDFDAATLRAVLQARKRLLKPMLLDQTVVAGLGNIYVDEALWEARLHPARRSASLTADEIRALHKAIRKVLKRGLHNKGTTLGKGTGHFASLDQEQGRNQRNLRVFRRDDSPCPRCRTGIRRILIGQRGTHFCPLCQADETAGKVFETANAR